MPADLTDADLDAIAKLLRDTIAGDRFPLAGETEIVSAA